MTSTTNEVQPIRRIEPSSEELCFSIWPFLIVSIYFCPYYEISIWSIWIKVYFSAYSNFPALNIWFFCSYYGKCFCVNKATYGPSYDNKYRHGHQISQTRNNFCKWMGILPYWHLPYIFSILRSGTSVPHMWLTA